MAHILPSGGGKALMNVDDSALLLLDHQSGLFQTVKDITVAELRANVMALSRIATLLKLPVIKTASVPDGPNGPVMPEIAELAPHAVYVPRHGEVNAWDNDLFVKAVRDTGKDTDHGWRLDERVRHVSCTRCQGGRLQRLCRR